MSKLTQRLWKGKSGCYDCGLDYQDDGWIEAIIPDKIWNRISPTKDQSGILCITCISRRLKKAGYKKVPIWFCGTEPLILAWGDPSEEEASLYILRYWEPNTKKEKKMKEIIEVVSRAFNRGYDVAKQEIPGDKMYSDHNIKSALKEEIEHACKTLNLHCDDCGEDVPVVYCTDCGCLH